MHFHYFRLQLDQPLPEVDYLTTYKAVVVIETSVDAAWRNSVCDWLVRTGCLYVMAWGQGCRSWDDCVDIANLEMFEFGEIPEDKFVITTWHSEEVLDEVVWFAKHAAIHPTGVIEDVVFLHIGSVCKRSEFEEIFNKAI